MSLTIIHTLNQWKIPIFDIKSFQLPTAIIPKLVPSPRLHLRIRVWLEHAQVWRKQGQGSGDWGRAKICQEIVTENLISDNWLGMNSRNTFVIQKQNNNANLNSIQSHFHYIIIFFLFIKFGFGFLQCQCCSNLNSFKWVKPKYFYKSPSCQLKNLTSTSISIKILQWIQFVNLCIYMNSVLCVACKIDLI